MSRRTAEAMTLKETERETTALGADGDTGAPARERILEAAQRVFAG